MSKILAYITNDNNINYSIEKPTNAIGYINEIFEVCDLDGNRKLVNSVEEKNQVLFLIKSLHKMQTDEYFKFREFYKEKLDTIDKNWSSTIDHIEKNLLELEKEKYYKQKKENDDNFIEMSINYNEKYSELIQEATPPVTARLEFARKQIKRNISKNEISDLITNMNEKNTGINGWDNEAIETVNNWRVLYKEHKYIYEWILERNQRISTNLNLISVISSSIMGCFSAFKLWIQDNRTFQATSDIIMLFSNFLIAAITTSSKRYIDDNRNEKIKIYVEEISKFLGNIGSELVKSPEYRQNANDFILSHQEIYLKLSTTKPVISLDELTKAKASYKIFLDTFLY